MLAIFGIQPSQVSKKLPICLVILHSKQVELAMTYPISPVAWLRKIPISRAIERSSPLQSAYAIFELLLPLKRTLLLELTLHCNYYFPFGICGTCSCASHQATCTAPPKFPHQFRYISILPHHHSVLSVVNFLKLYITYTCTHTLLEAYPQIKSTSPLYSLYK